MPAERIFYQQTIVLLDQSFGAQFFSYPLLDDWPKAALAQSFKKRLSFASGAWGHTTAGTFIYKGILLPLLSG